MSDFHDYLEATTGYGGNGYGDMEDAEEAREVAALQRSEKDAVLCLVDARLAMFAVPPAPATGDVKVKEEGTSPPLARAGVTPFSQAMRMVGRLYQDKIITSDRDLLGLVLYNTAQHSNPCELPGVYVIHPFNTLDVERVQEVEQLEAAGVPGTGAYQKFVKDIGHRDPQLSATLDEAFWMAQHMLLTVRANVVKYRRIFVFTNDDDPTRGDALQTRRCVEKARTMHEEGVAMEVFALRSTTACAGSDEGETVGSGRAPGTAPGSHSNHPRPPSTTAKLSTATGSGPDTIFASAPTSGPGPSGGQTLPFPSLHPHHSPGTDETLSVHSASTELRGAADFRSQRFWDKLLANAVQPAAWATAATSRGSGGGYMGSVHIQSALHTSSSAGVEEEDEDYTYVVLDKLHPQRPYMNTTLAIGLRSDGGSVPRMAVSVYTPIMAATGPKAERLEASTNALVKRQAHLVRKVAPTAAGGKEDEEEVADTAGSEGTALVRKEDVQYGVSAAGLMLPFSKAERARVTEVAAAGAPLGFTILCFKAYEDAMAFKHTLSRGSFLHANLRQGGEDSMRCFVQLVRTLRRQGKVAIALHRRNARTAPRLVALVPSPVAADSATTITSLPLAEQAGAKQGWLSCASALKFPTESLPAEGLGLYVVPLPYADDIRPLPPPEGAVKTERASDDDARGQAGPPPAVEHVQVAERLISALTVPYDITAVANPSVQLQYHMLKRLALQSLAQTPAATTGSAVKPEGGGAGTNARDGFRDFTQPDWEGMSKHAGLFRQFRQLVLGSDYDAEALCPQPKTAAAGTAAAAPTLRRAGGVSSSDAAGSGQGEGEDIVAAVRGAAETNTWSKLTVAQLREYLRVVKASGGGAKRKDELIQAAKAAFAASSNSRVSGVKKEEK